MRKPSRKTLVKKLDDLQREILFNYWGKKCVMCGSTDKVGVSHVFSRKNYITRWDIEPGGNAYPGCWPCNFRHVRDQYHYFKWFKNMYGDKRFEELRFEWNQTRPFKNWELEEKIEEYKKLLKETK